MGKRASCIGKRPWVQILRTHKKSWMWSHKHQDYCRLLTSSLALGSVGDCLNGIKVEHRTEHSASFSGFHTHVCIHTIHTHTFSQPQTNLVTMWMSPQEILKRFNPAHARTHTPIPKAHLTVITDARMEHHERPSLRLRQSWKKTGWKTPKRKLLGLERWLSR